MTSERNEPSRVTLIIENNTQVISPCLTANVNPINFSANQTNAGLSTGIENPKLNPSTTRPRNEQIRVQGNSITRTKNTKMHCDRRQREVPQTIRKCVVRLFKVEWYNTKATHGVRFSSAREGGQFGSWFCHGFGLPIWEEHGIWPYTSHMHWRGYLE